MYQKLMGHDTSTADVFDALKPGDGLLEYRIEQILGQGGFGITYLARDTLLDAQFAIKEFLPPELAARSSGNSVTVRSESTREPFEWAKRKFLSEAQVLARFSHPNLVRVSRFFEANGTVYFVMDFVKGQTLSERLKSGRIDDPATLRSILLPLADGLAEVHAAGVLHRDIKPGNIILRPDGSPILIDFGAARQAFGSVTKSMLNVVTAGYAPIEQYSDGMPQGPWTDIYALGGVAYRMIAGRKPQDAVERLRDDPLVPAADVAAGELPGDLLASIDWALAVHPEERPQSLADWRAALTGARPVTRAASGPASVQAHEPTERLRPSATVASPTTEEPTVIHASANRSRLGGAPRLNALQRSWPRSALIGAGVLVLAAVAWVLRPIHPADESRHPEPVEPSVTESLSRALTGPSVQKRITEAEEQLAGGNRDAVLASIERRLEADENDPAALVLRGHLAFADERRAEGIADYALALAARPTLSSNEQLASNLVSALGWVTVPAEAVIKTYGSEAMYRQLARRALETGPVGRGHAYRILEASGEEQRVDPLEFARVELTDRPECEARIAAIETIGELGDASWIPLLKAQIPNWLTNLCLRGAVNRAVARLEKRPAAG